MRVSDGHIETLGIVVIDIEEGIQIDHVIIVPENTGVGVSALGQEDRVELILSRQNVTEKDLHAEQIGLIQDRQAMIEEISPLQELMMNTR